MGVVVKMVLTVDRVDAANFHSHNLWLFGAGDQSRW
jgi:hypothetical protein